MAKNLYAVAAMKYTEEVEPDGVEGLIPGKVYKVQLEDAMEETYAVYDGDEYLTTVDSRTRFLNFIIKIGRNPYAI